MKTSAYRPEIDGLRAFAVLSVVAFHAFPGTLEGGFIGVDVFFVISGFLITSHIFQSLDQGQFSLLDFFGRRIRRIFPALIMVMAASLAFGWFVLLADEYAQLAKHVASGAAFFTNFILVDESGYFDNAAETKPMLHLWSLAVEEQFYILWPLVLWFAWRRKYSLLKITLAVAFASFVFNLIYINVDPVEAFYWPMGRFWELLAGSILAWCVLYRADYFSRTGRAFASALAMLGPSRNGTSDGVLASNVMASFGFVLLVLGVVGLHEGLAFPSAWTLVPVLGAVLIIAGGATAWLNRIFLMNPIAVWFGLISYPLYLWHWPILSFLQIIEGEGLPSWSLRLAAVAASILLAWLTYRLIERPIRFGAGRSRKAILLIVAMGCMGGIGLLIHSNGGATPYNVSLKYIADAKDDWSFPDGLVSRDGFYATSETPANVLMFGDSHIEAFGPRVVDLYDKGLAREVVVLTGGGCAPLPRSFRGEKYVETCSERFAQFEEVLASHPIDTIILGGSYGAFLRHNRGAFFVQDDGERVSLETEEGRQASISAFYDWVERLSDTYTVVVVSHAASSSKFSPANLLKGRDGARTLPLSARVENTPFRINNALELEIEALIRPSGAVFVSQSKKVCPDGVCLALTEDGRPKYKDSSHMRPFFVITHMDVLDRYLLIDPH